MNGENKGIDFLIEENIKLKEQSLFFLGQIESNERFALLSSGAIWAFVASTKWNEALNIIIWIPSIITAVFYLKRLMLTKTTGVVGDYIKNSEKTISEITGIEAGWENYWARHKYERSKFGKSYMKWWGRIFWLLVFIANTSLAVFFPFQSVLTK